MLESWPDGPMLKGFPRCTAQEKEGFIWSNPEGASRPALGGLSGKIPRSRSVAGMDWLEGVKNPLTQECETGSPIHLPLNKLDLRHRSFHDTVVDPPG
jgi:hypothetical protein